ncbi:MAG: hypothetical protein AAGB29_11635 [Planctomycetota bacterium]
MTHRRHVVLELQEGYVSGEGEHRYTLDLDRTLALRFHDDPVVNLQSQWGLHGGFAIDRRPGQGHVYLYAPRVGVYRVSPDLTSKELLIPEEDFGRGANLHNMTFFVSEAGGAFLALTSNNRSAVWIYTVDGERVHELTHPDHNDYYRNGGKFSPTDSDFIDGKLYVTTGYSPGDYIVTADPFTGEWLPEFFGGKGDADGQFKTAHGITAHPHDHSLVVSDREHHRGQIFAPSGDLERVVPIPHRPCDVDYHPDDPGLAVVAGLAGPILILSDHEVIATIRPRDEIKIPLARHIHNAAFMVIDGRTHILAQSWNPGMVFVLKPVPITAP